MEMIASGAFGKPDYHLIYINSIIGFVLSGLYSIIHSIPWYGLFQILISIICFSTIMYVFMDSDYIQLRILVVLFLFLASYEAYTKIQFTKTAAYLATTGYVLIAHSYKSDNKRLKQFVGILMLFNSFMMRTGMFLGCSAVAACCLLPVLIDSVRDLKNNGEIIKDVFKVALISLLFVISAFTIDKLAYSSEEWKYFTIFNEYTTQFEDINFPSYQTYESEYKKLNIDEEDFELYIAIDHNDPDLFNIDKMESIRKLEPYKKIDSNEVVMFFLRGYNTLFKQKTLAPFTLFLLLLLIYFLFFSEIRLNTIVPLICTGIAALLAFFYTYVMHGWFDRTTISIMFSLIATVMYIIKPKTYNNRLLIYVIIPIILLVCIYSWNDYFKWNMKAWRVECKENLSIINELNNDSDHLYISRTALPLWKRYYTPYDEIKLGAMANYSPLGDWMTNAPFAVNVLKQYDVVNPYKDIVNNGKAYLIGRNGDIELVEKYIRKHYYSDLELVLVKEIGSYQVYSLISNSGR